MSPDNIPSQTYYILNKWPLFFAVAYVDSTHQTDDDSNATPQVNIPSHARRFIVRSESQIVSNLGTCSMLCSSLN
jgi:hypothetical protein